MSALPVPRMSRDPFQIPLLDYFRRRSERGGDPKAFGRFSTAVSALRRFLALGDKAPTIGHLSTLRIEGLAVWLVELRGREPSTADRICRELFDVARLAVSDGLLAEPPRYRPLKKRTGAERIPFTLDEIERILAQCSLETAGVAGVPGRDFWPALIYLVLNLQISAPAVLALPRAAFRWRKGAGEIAAGGFLYAVHPLTADALALLPDDREQLLPFNGDRHDMLYYHFNRILRAAGLPRQKGRSFDRVLAAQLGGVELLERIDPARVERLTAELRVAGDRRAARQAERNARNRRETQAAVPSVLRLPKELREIITIGHDSPRSLRTWFREVYRPKRLLGASPASIDAHETLCRQLANFAGCEPTLDVLESPGFADRFLEWKLEGGASAFTVESYRKRILAVHRYARRKKYLVGEWPDIEPIRKPKRRPTAWSLDQFSRLLAAAATLPGHHQGLAWSKLLPAMCLTVYDSALRVGALISLRVDEFDPAGLLNCPAEVSKTRCEQSWRISTQTCDAIEAMGPLGDRQMLFGGPRREPGRKCDHRELREAKRNFTRKLRLALKIAGLPATSRDLWHKIRRTSCTWAAAETSIAEASQHAGHGSVAVTVTHYIDGTKLGRGIASKLPRPSYQAEPGRVVGLLEYRPAGA